MDQSTVNEIAKAIAGQPVPLEGHVYGLIALITAACGSLGAFVGSYLSERGKNFATKVDFDGLQEQLKRSTALTEAIKREVEHEAWTRREWSTLRWQKLEEMLGFVHDTALYLDEYRAAALEGKFLTRPNPIERADTIVTLYFPHLRAVFYDCARPCRQLLSLFIEHAQAVSGIKKNEPIEQQIKAREEAFGAMKAKYEKIYPEWLRGRAALDAAAAIAVLDVAGLNDPEERARRVEKAKFWSSSDFTPGQGRE